MSLLDVLRGAVKIADQTTKSWQGLVTLEHFAAFGTYGPTHQSSTQLLAIVDWKQSQVRTAQGVMAVSRAYVMFLDVAALMAATNNEGLNDNDIIHLPDGSTGPILNMTGFMDAGTTKPVATEVYLG
jgi:hypothetical protein